MVTISTNLTIHLRNHYRNASSNNHLHAYRQDLQVHQVAHIPYEGLPNSRNRSHHDVVQLLYQYLNVAFLHQLPPSRYKLFSHSVTRATDLQHQDRRKQHLNRRIGHGEARESRGVQHRQSSTLSKKLLGPRFPSQPIRLKRTPQWLTSAVDR